MFHLLKFNYGYQKKNAGPPGLVPASQKKKEKINESHPRQALIGDLSGLKMQKSMWVTDFGRTGGGILFGSLGDGGPGGLMTGH